MKERNWLAMVLALGLALGLAGGAAAATLYHYMELPLNGYGGANAISNSGYVSGGSYPNNDEMHAWVWSKSGGMQDLGSLGGKSLWVHDVNDKGQVVGWAETADDGNPEHAFCGSASGGLQDLGVLPGGTDSRAYRINAKGQVSGNAYTGEGYARAVLWDESGGLQELGTLGGNQSEALDINARGQVVGGAEDASSKWRPFFWTSSRGMQDLGTLDGYDSGVAMAINKKSQVVGNLYNTSTGEYHACLWHKPGVMQELGSLSGNSLATHINSNGQVIGWWRSGNDSRSFFWHKAVGMFDLGTLGGNSTLAYALNSKGQVVGESRNPLGDQRPFLWTAADGMRDLNNLVVDLPEGVTLGFATGINDKGRIIGSVSNGNAYLLIPAK